MRAVSTRTAALPLLAVSLHAGADTIHVPGDYPTIQLAINAASDGDEVVVAPGVHPGPVDMLGKAIKLRSSEGAHVTTISSPQTTAITCATEEGPDTIIIGFTVTGTNLASSGGGMVIDSSSPLVRNCRFINNVALSGGAVEISGGNPMFSNCEFVNNSAVGPPNNSGFGGAVFMSNDSPRLINCTFRGNLASLYGGAITSFNANMQIVNSLFVDNVAQSGGGALFVLSTGHDFVSAIVNCTIVDNQIIDPDPLGGGILYLNVDEPDVLTNSIVRGNIGGQIVASSSTSVTFCNVEGGYEGEGNIDADPMFRNAADADYTFLTGSPCIDAANNAAVPADAPTDLNAAARFIDDPLTVDTGTGGCLVVDMGAYEFQDGLTTCCVADVDGNGIVSVDDLLAVINAWGPCPGCPADLDGNGNVDVEDLLTVISHWGLCK